MQSVVYCTMLPPVVLKINEFESIASLHRFLFSPWWQRWDQTHTSKETGASNQTKYKLESHRYRWQNLQPIRSVHRWENMFANLVFLTFHNFSLSIIMHWFCMWWLYLAYEFSLCRRPITIKTDSGKSQVSNIICFFAFLFSFIRIAPESLNVEYLSYIL